MVILADDQILHSWNKATIPLMALTLSVSQPIQSNIIQLKPVYPYFWYFPNGKEERKKLDFLFFRLAGMCEKWRDWLDYKVKDTSHYLYLPHSPLIFISSHLFFSPHCFLLLILPFAFLLPLVYIFCSQLRIETMPNVTAWTVTSLENPMQIAGST